MSDVKKQKSKIRNNQILSKSSSQATSTNSSNNASEKTSGSVSSSSALSLADKLDMNNLKTNTINYVKSSTQAKHDPTNQMAARKACIDYALELVISNLIVSGQLDPTKAHQMRTSVMKGQIASMCDKILERRGRKISTTSTSKKLPDPKNNYSHPPPSSAVSNPSGGKVTKWAVQPAALPITIITDKALSKLPGVIGEKKGEVVGKKLGGSSNLKSLPSASSMGEAKKLKTKISKSNAQAHPVRSADSHSNVQPKPKTELKPVASGGGIIKTASASASNTEKQKSRSRHKVQPASSEVPSNNSLEANARNLTGNSVAVAERASLNLKVPRSVQFEGKEKEANKAQAEATPSNKTQPEATLPEIPSTDTTNTEPFQPLTEDAALGNLTNQNPSSAPPDTPPVTAENGARNDSALSCPSTAKTLNSIISSSSCISTGTKGFQMSVDMRGFQNDEIAMEVEGRQLIFLASRPKKNDQNLRKVTEIIEVHEGVKMESLKIGRRKDGFVVIEEHETEAQ